MKGWLAPLAAAAAVVALLVGVHYAVTGGTRVGPGPDRVQRLVDPGPPAPAPVDLPRSAAVVTGYWSEGDRLVLTYRLRVADCSVRVVGATVVESGAAATVRLQGRRVEREAAVCPGERESPQVSVLLRRPLTERAVLDAARADRAVRRLG